MKKLIAVGVAALLLPLGTALAEPSGTLRQAHDLGFGTNSSLDPSSQGRVFAMIDKVMNRLVRPGLDGVPQPDLAESWSASDDATVWTFNLRKGVKFHDGTDLDAGDVKYTYERVLDPEMGSPARSAIKMIEGIRAVDDHTVEITLNTPYADLPLQLMDYRLRIIPNDSGDTIATSGIGTGPFRLVRFDPQGTTVFEANLDYFEGVPKLAQIELIGIPDAQARFQALLAGQIDLERGIRQQQARILEANDSFEVQNVPTGSWRGIVFRTDVAPTNDPKVRKALRLLVDREALVQLVLSGGGQVACDSPTAPTDQYHHGQSCPQDNEMVRQLLEEAGYGDGLDVEIYLSTLEPTWPTLGQAYQQMAAEVGINVKLTNLPPNGYWNTGWMVKDAYMTRWFERPIDQALHEIYLSGAKWNESFFNDPEFDNMLAAARRELDFETRKKIYIDAQNYLIENTGTLIPYTVNNLVGLSNKVQHYPATKEDAVLWHLVSLSE